MIPPRQTLGGLKAARRRVIVFLGMDFLASAWPWILRGIEETPRRCRPGRRSIAAPGLGDELVQSGAHTSVARYAISTRPSWYLQEVFDGQVPENQGQKMRASV
ncbi:hypothetical protein GE09DRAFT_1078042 [Coniochaeta sp. 2T2.1]|nr:hypothetical protein GE09DRAFT_1078042 [Coniochaeta sp. 2T2.1]